MPQEVTIGVFSFSHMFADFSIRGRTNCHACLFDSQSTGNTNARKPPGRCRDPLRKYALNHIITYGYDAKGNRASVTIALLRQTTFAYDAMSRLTTITYPDSTTSTFADDSRGRRTSVTDQNGKGTTYAYDDADRLTSVTGVASHVTYYAYNTENNLTSISDANSKHSFLLRNSVLDNRKSVKKPLSEKRDLPTCRREAVLEWLPSGRQFGSDSSAWPQLRWRLNRNSDPASYHDAYKRAASFASVRHQTPGGTGAAVLEEEKA